MTDTCMGVEAKDIPVFLKMVRRATLDGTFADQLLWNMIQDYPMLALHASKLVADTVIPFDLRGSNSGNAFARNELTCAEMSDIQRAYAGNRKVDAIKALRGVNKCGLLEAKNLVEYWIAEKIIK